MLRKIFGRVIVLVIRLRRGGEPCVESCRVKFRNGNADVRQRREITDIEGEFKKKIKEPVLVLITGDGVIRKVCGEETFDKMIENPELFCHREQSADGEEVLFFARKEVIDVQLKRLRNLNLPVAGVYLDQDMVEESFFNAIVGRQVRLFFEHKLRYRELVRPGDTGNLLASLLFERIKLFLLLFLFLLLVVNHFIRQVWQERLREQQMELHALRQYVSKQDKVSKEMARWAEAFNRKGISAFALLPDRIASVIPAGIVLESMSIIPLRKPIEEGKAPVVREKLLELQGEASEQGEVIRFTGALSGLGFVRQVKLTTLYKHNETGRFMFRVEVGL